MDNQPNKIKERSIEKGERLGEKMERNNHGKGKGKEKGGKERNVGIGSSDAGHLVNFHYQKVPSSSSGKIREKQVKKTPMKNEENTQKHSKQFSHSSYGRKSKNNSFFSRFKIFCFTLSLIYLIVTNSSFLPPLLFFLHLILHFLIQIL
jgi:hypothetical protein